MKQVTLLVGCPGSGKTWVTNQIQDKYHHVAHDNHIDKDYIKATIDGLCSAKKPVLIETPFSMSKIVEGLSAYGVSVKPVYIQEKHYVIAERYKAREGKEIPKGHLTRQETYLHRAKETGDFYGTPEEVLNYLRTKGE